MVSPPCYLLSKYFPLSGNDVLPQCMFHNVCVIVCEQSVFVCFIERLSCIPYVLSYMKSLKNRKTCYELKHNLLHWVVVLLALIKQQRQSQIAHHYYVDSWYILPLHESFHYVEQYRPTSYLPRAFFFFFNTPPAISLLYIGVSRLFGLLFSLLHNPFV